MIKKYIYILKKEKKKELWRHAINRLFGLLGYDVLYILSHVMISPINKFIEEIRMSLLHRQNFKIQK